MAAPAWMFSKSCFYVDDMVILSPTAMGLHNLLDVCTLFSETPDVIYNCNAYVCMTITSTEYKIIDVSRVNVANYGSCLEMIITLRKG